MAGEDPLLFYPVEVFQRLGAWLTLVGKHPDLPAEKIMELARQADTNLAEFLEDCSFPEAWQRLRANHATPAQRLRAFHGWFDGLKTLRLVHHLCDTGFERQEPARVLPALFRWSGLEDAGPLPAQLARLRRRQARPALFSIEGPKILC